MASPSATTGFRPLKLVFQRPNTLQIMARRCGAWAAEVSLIAASALIPFSIGAYAQLHLLKEPVPLNPLLARTQETLGKTFATPTQSIKVAPLANLFWTGALIMPIAVAGWQIYLLGKTGKTLPKRWFGLQVITASGAYPGWQRALKREVVGRWGLPLSTAYALWRCSGSAPNLAIFLGLGGVMLLAETAIACFDPHRRALHDRLAGTFVLDADEGVPRFKQFDAPKAEGNGKADIWQKTDEDEAIAALVLTPESRWPRPALWYWMRRHPGLTLLITGLAAMTAVLATFVGTQVYIQTQINWRQVQQQNREALLTLANQFTVNKQLGAILALGNLAHPDAALQLLADLLSLETDAQLMQALGQAMVSNGPKALPYLQRLNQSLNNDLESLRYGGDKEERLVVRERQRVSQRAIAKILTLYNEQIRNVDLSRVNLAQNRSGSRQFTLVLDYLDLSGIKFRSSILTNASLREVCFSSPGEDGFFGTFDDAIADLSGADLKQSNLSGAFLSHVIMNRANFIGANLTKANLSHVRASGANFSSTQLMQANLHQAILNNASLTGADLQQANFSNANLQAARLAQVKASGASFQSANLTKSEWQKADLSGADFSGSNLQNADLSSSRLVGANLSNANLEKVNFRNANLSSADLRGSKLAGADFQGAIFVTIKPTKPNQFIQTFPVNTISIGLQGVDFTLAKNLNVKQITYICEQGGLHPKCLPPER
ncbi:MAG: pentapeptide repeat-containing protein [Oscillatoriaceae bacterium SKW80]|nr:pentapeptide repeat-containing protein [Oscillatoriaceae bacterium SKYG93]MCX8119255.1 pentapeptide repeat-containing protein [Oscillatoriaceae bacterium SKW80]MDW8454722.1 pentapeptide repeat-containing protein [Oscillatoriaceae cyanobacterium SKYGB_i_bin93]HIK28498.1 pentapeptide repeat-containing protein [Oscillatoriaceae cyanobacterium M7585_C2015_266]